MIIQPADVELVDIHGYLSFALYVHYFVPGSFKIRSVLLISAHKYIPESNFFNTRRWWQKGETPYPGYCRAPGSQVCLPLLCNCQKLTDMWKKAQEKNKQKKNHKET